MNEALCEQIRQAFAGVTLGDGIGLREGQGLDDYADKAKCARLRATDEKEDWSRIPVKELNHCHSSLSFFDAEGMRFHLPAFMIAELHGKYRFGMSFCLTQHPDKAKDFGLLSPAQRRAVRAFLEHLAESPNYEYERTHIVRALNGYWREP